MKFKKRKITRNTDWEWWFAWYPVRIKNNYYWLEKVLRRRHWCFSEMDDRAWYHQYKLLPEDEYIHPLTLD